MSLVTVRAINEHKYNGKRYHIGDTYDVSEDALSWLESNALAAPDHAFDALWACTEGSILAPPELRSHYKVKWPTGKNAERLPRVIQLCQYDPGNAAYRYHSALNASGAAQSVFVRWGHSNPHCDLRQYDGDEERSTVEKLFFSADVILTHIDYRPLTHEVRMMMRNDQRLIRFYHGSIEPKRRELLVENDVDNARHAVQIGARLYHQRFSQRMHWLPIPMPIKDYKLREPLKHVRGERMRVAHSPTRRSIKGTDAFLQVVSDLNAEGYRIDPVLIEGLSHGEAIKAKQSCHVTFDSFWLGIQGSGLEAGAMQQCVIAGDTLARADYLQEFNDVPYTFADNAEQLRMALARAHDDEEWRVKEAARTHNYVKSVHSYEAVGSAFAKIALRENLYGVA